jgi:3-isopropylmalate dehydrogenase
MLIVRELTGGLYFGARMREPERGDGMGQYASDLCEYTEAEIARVVEFAFKAAEGRRGNVVSVDKANVLETSRLWRETTASIAKEHPGVAYSNMLVDNTAMQLVANPAQFDVLVTENTFGDILSDEASMLTGSLGMLASASLGTYTPLFEPCHGSAPDIAGKGIANPMAQILSVALMCRYAFGEDAAADMIEAAVEKTLDAGWRTPDVKSVDTPEEKVLGTESMTQKIIENL